MLMVYWASVKMEMYALFIGPLSDVDIKEEEEEP